MAAASSEYNLEFAYDLFLIFPSINFVKIAKTWRKSAGVRSLHTSVASQRLHAGDLSGKKKFKSNYHTDTESKYIHSNYITGFSDGESSFHISILKKKGYKVGYQVLPIFTIQLHIKDLGLLNKLKSYFGVGVITIKGRSNSAIYSVQSIKDITNSIIPHFDKYPLLTQKKADYILFKQVIDLMNVGKHLTREGLAEIVGIKASMNKGLNESLKKEFHYVLPVQRPEVKIDLNSFLVNPDWLIGFVEAEGCFICLVRKNPSHLLGYQVTLSFSLTQHIRDLDLMTSLKEKIGLGKIYINSSIVRWTITRNLEIDTLISMFNGRLLGTKNLDFVDFCKIQEIIKSGLHKSQEGLNTILLIKRNMNKIRIDES